MTSLEKTFYGLMLTLATAFGALVYNAMATRVVALESQTREIEREAKERTITDQVTLAEVRADIKYMRQAIDRIEHRLGALPLIPSRPYSQAPPPYVSAPAAPPQSRPTLSQGPTLPQGP